MSQKKRSKTYIHSDEYVEEQLNYYRKKLQDCDDRLDGFREQVQAIMNEKGEYTKAVREYETALGKISEPS